MTSRSGLDLTAKVKDLLRLAKEQGHLTYDDLNDVLPDDVITPADLDQVLTKLRSLDDRDHRRPPKWTGACRSSGGDEEEGARYDALDDPVRMYLQQMGKVPLLTREQEVEICKRIEDAEGEARRIIYGFGFTGKEHLALAEKLLAEPPKERFDRVVVDKQVDSREPSSQAPAPADQTCPHSGPAGGCQIRRLAARDQQEPARPAAQPVQAASTGSSRRLSRAFATSKRSSRK